MALYESEIADLCNGKFFLDASEITLKRRNDPDDVYSGPGFIRQTDDGKLEYTLYDQRREANHLRFSWPVGGLIPDADHYDLQLVDYNGRNWEASRTLVSTSGQIGRKAVYARETFSRSLASKKALTVTISGCSFLAFSQSQRTQAPESLSKDFPLNS